MFHWCFSWKSVKNNCKINSTIDLIHFLKSYYCCEYIVCVKKVSWVHWKNSGLKSFRFFYLSREIGPKKGVLRTPVTGPFFPSDTDIQTKINFGRHRHSKLSVRHSTPHFSPTLSFPNRHQTLPNISSRHLTFRPPFTGLKACRAPGHPSLLLVWHGLQNCSLLSTQVIFIIGVRKKSTWLAPAHSNLLLVWQWSYDLSLRDSAHFLKHQIWILSPCCHWATCTPCNQCISYLLSISLVALKQELRPRTKESWVIGIHGD